MKRTLSLIVLLCIAASLIAGERETIWPKGKMPHRQDHQIAAMTDETSKKDFDADGYASMNSVKTWEKMLMMGIQSELHTLACRTHCFQRNSSPGTGSYTHFDRIWEFLTSKKFNR